MPRGKTSKTKYREKLIYMWAMEHHPVTVRQLFYRLSVLDAVPKNESGCKTVGRICAQMRRDGELPFEWIADNTRWQRKPRTYNSLEDALTNTAQIYRRNLWQSQQGLVEIWLEKDALAGVVYPVTEEWDVPSQNGYVPQHPTTADKGRSRHHDHIENRPKTIDF